MSALEPSPFADLERERERERESERRLLLREEMKVLSGILAWFELLRRNQECKWRIDCGGAERVGK